MRPTWFGLRAALFHAVMVAAFFGTHYSNVFFLLLGFLTLVGLSGVLGARRNLAGVTARLPEPPPVPSGAPATVPLLVEGPDAPRFRLEGTVQLVGGATLRGDLELLRGRAALALAVPPLPRGCTPLACAWVSSTHPFGLVRARRRVDVAGELCVYPAPRPLTSGRSVVHALDELLAAPESSAGDLQPSGLRDHRQGDGLRGVHWRASARRGRLVVREWEGGHGQGFEVVLDRRAAVGDLEEALTVLSTLVQVAREAKETLRVHTQGLSATYGDGHAPWVDALRFLARADALPADGPAPPAASPSVPRLPRPAAARGRVRA